MPRSTIDLSLQVEYLSVLDEEGDLDRDLLPEVDDEVLLKMLRTMMVSRTFDERQIELQRQGRIGTFAPAIGQEAAQVAAVAALEASDWVVPAFRETTAAIWRGTPLEALLLFNAGYNEGIRIPKEAHDLPIAIPVASQIPHAAGLAYAQKLRDTGDVVLTFFGDGATSEGDFHESANFAGVFQVPLVMVCQNNQWAISIPREEQTGSKTLAQKAIAYGVPGLQVDGNDVLAVYRAVTEAVERAREGDGPTMIECVTYRLSLHTTADDPSKYRDEEEVERWEARDPIPRLRRYLVEREVLDEDGVGELEDEVEKAVESGWERAEEAMEELDDPLVMFDHVLAERPATLERQRRELAAHLGIGEKGGDRG